MVLEAGKETHMTDWNVNRWERLEEIAQSVAPDETLSLLVGDRIIEARITGTRPAPKANQWGLPPTDYVLCDKCGKFYPSHPLGCSCRGGLNTLTAPDAQTQEPDYPTWADGYQVNMLTPE